MPDTVVRTFEEALAVSLDTFRARYDESFHHVDTDLYQRYVTGKGLIGYHYCVAPDARPERYSSALIDVDENTLKPVHIGFNYSQWLFRERVERPYREVLAADPSVVGYATYLAYTRMDDLVWTEDQLEEYMGRGGGRDPMVEAVAFLREDVGGEEAADTIKRVQDALWELGTSMRLTVALKGMDPYQGRIYSTDSDKQLRASRGEPPTREDIAQWVDDNLYFAREDPHPWDGVSGTVGDTDAGARPVVTWK